jgi:hypothetical protein
MTANPEKEIAFNKAKNIIASCTKCKQIKGSKRYLELYLKRFGDENSYNELYHIYIAKKTELKCFY